MNWKNKNLASTKKILCSGHDNTQETVGSASTSAVDGARIGIHLLAELSHSENRRLSINWREEGMRKGENRCSGGKSHGDGKCNRMDAHARSFGVTTSRATKAHARDGNKKGPQRQEQRRGVNGYCSSVEGNLVVNKGELQYYDYSVSVVSV